MTADTDVVTPDIARVHAFAWQPGAHMHTDWWVSLGMHEWQAEYAAWPACRRAIDAVIVARRGFPAAALPASIDPAVARLVALTDRLPVLTMALGLAALNCPTHLLLRKYRTRVAAVLGESACDSLLMLRSPGGGETRHIEPAQLPDEALIAGTNWLHQTITHDPVWKAIEILLPPPRTNGCRVPTQCAMPFLLKIARFL